MQSATADTFSIRSMLPRPGAQGEGRLTRMVANSVDRLIGFDAIKAVYDDIRSRPTGSFSARALASLGIDAEVRPEELKRIPATGPAIIAANHPLGGVDGLLLLETVLRIRPDVKLLANAFLARLPELAEHVIPVDVFDPRNPVNVAALRSSLRWLKDGGCLATFPAGEVSRLRFRDGQVSDGVWSASVSTMARMTDAPVVPVLFDASNSWLFQTVGQLHGLIRTAMLPRELLWKRNATVKVRIGTKISSERLRKFATAAEASEFLRARVYLLADEATAVPVARPQAPVAEQADPALIQREIDALPPERTLARLGQQRVILASAGEIPQVLREIGRLREITFRAVGEGTGQPRDLDKFDLTYKHLFVVDDASGDIVGAYRLGLTDEILASGGLSGLYTSTLFRYEPSELRRLVPGIELGRSFVRAEYQRHPASLLLLWQGIGRFVGNNPQYRLLFGTASISDTYPSVTKMLLVRFITEAFSPGEWGRVAQPTTPPKFSTKRGREVQIAYSQLDNINDAEELVASIDPKGRGIPTLLRLYLRLGARLVGFNVDPAFGDALDGLIVVDLVKAPARQVARYMGDELHREFLRYHKAAPATVG